MISTCSAFLCCMNCFKFMHFSLPQGEIKIEEDVSVYFSSDFVEVGEDNDKNEKSTDFIEESATDDDVDDDVVNDTNFEGNLTKIAPEEIDEILKSSDMDRSEIIHTYKMEGFKSTVYIRVANKSTLTCQSVGGKVFNGSKWKSTKNVVVEV